MKFYRQIFRDQGMTELTDEACELCSQMVLNPESLKPRTYESFAEAGVNATVQQVRYDHYCEKRQANLEMLDEMIRERRTGAVMNKYTISLKSGGGLRGVSRLLPLVASIQGKTR